MDSKLSKDIYENRRILVLLLPAMIALLVVPYALQSQVNQRIAAYNLGAGSECPGMLITGSCQASRPLTTAEKVLFQADVSAPGSYIIHTDTVNGYGFRATGHFSTKGIQLVVLQGHGIPLAGQTDIFTITGSGNISSCTFTIRVAPWQCGMPFTDRRDSQSYRTVPIGDQCWMAQNLNFGTQINYMWNQKNNRISEKYCYLGNKSNCDIYGGLYQWDELMNYTTTEGTRGLCPEGWHIPTDPEWCAATRTIDPEIDCQVIGASGNDGGGAMKTTGTTYWSPPNDGATNLSEFSAMPGGHRDYPGSFSSRAYIGFFWSSSECGPAHAWTRSLHYFDDKVNRDDYIKSNGFSVRCIRDAQPAAGEPTIDP